MSKDIVVGESKDIMNPNSRTYEERRQELLDIDSHESKMQEKAKKSSYRNFVQINRDTYKLEDRLMKNNPFAYRVWRFLIDKMDNYNAVIISYNVLTEVFEVSRSTIYRAIKELEEGNYVKIFKSGTSNVYAINDEMVWSSWGNNRKYSSFSANVIVAESEQEPSTQKEIKLKEEKYKKINLE